MDWRRQRRLSRISISWAPSSYPWSFLFVLMGRCIIGPVFDQKSDFGLKDTFEWQTEMAL